MKRAFLLLLLILPARAATIIDPADDPSINDQLYRDEALLYPSVGTASGNPFNGSGVLIGDRWVLTAGHVALQKAGKNFTIGGVSYLVESTIIHPDFTLSPQLGFDLGLLYLATSVQDVEVAKMYQFSDSLGMIGLEASWVGIGFGGTGSSGATLTGSSLAMRAFTNVIDVFGDHPDYEGLPGMTFISDFDRPDGSTNNPASDASATRLEGGLAPGDSGGGVFVTVDGETYLIGINSYRSKLDSSAHGTNSTYGSINGATNLQLFHSWIFENTGIVAVPEPSVAFLVSLGGLLASFHRRRIP